jgi:hypothetical protein
MAPLHHDMARWCGGIVTSMIRGMNEYIFRMESIPFGTLEHIHVSGGEMILIYLAIACIMGWRVIKSPKWLMAAMVCLALTGMIHAWIKHTRMKQKVMVVMPLTRTRMLMMIEGTTARWLLTAFGPQDDRQIRMTMRAAGHHFGIDRHIIDTIPANRHFGVRKRSTESGADHDMGKGPHLDCRRYEQAVENSAMGDSRRTATFAPYFYPSIRSIRTQDPLNQDPLMSDRLR